MINNRKIMMKAEKFKRLTNDELLDPVTRKNIYETLLNYEENSKIIIDSIEKLIELKEIDDGNH